MVVIGSENFVLGFKALGIDTFAVDNYIEAASFLDKLGRSDYKIIYISEEIAEKIRDKIDEVTISTQKNIIALPSLESEGGFVWQRLKSLAAKAAGIDIFN